MCFCSQVANKLSRKEINAFVTSYDTHTYTHTHIYTHTHTYIYTKFKFILKTIWIGFTVAILKVCMLSLGSMGSSVSDRKNLKGTNEQKQVVKTMSRLECRWDARECRRWEQTEAWTQMVEP